MYKYLYLYLYMHVHIHICILICVRIRENEIIQLLINFLSLLSFLLHFLVPGTGTVFRIWFRFRCRSPQMNTVPTGSGSETLQKVHNKITDECSNE